jgi:uncharacterized protein YjbI with pentapeptide repeats
MRAHTETKPSNITLEEKYKFLTNFFSDTDLETIERGDEVTDNRKFNYEYIGDHEKLLHDLGLLEPVCLHHFLRSYKKNIELILREKSDMSYATSACRALILGITEVVTWAEQSKIDRVIDFMVTNNIPSHLIKSIKQHAKSIQYHYKLELRDKLKSETNEVISDFMNESLTEINPEKEASQIKEINFYTNFSNYTRIRTHSYNTPYHDCGLNASNYRFTGFDMSFTHIKIKFNNCIMTHANLDNAKISGSLIGCDLSYSTIRNASLAYTYLNHCNLDNAKLINSDLTSIDLSSCSFKGTNFDGSNLSGVKFIGYYQYGLYGLAQKLDKLAADDNYFHDASYFSLKLAILRDIIVNVDIVISREKNEKSKHENKKSFYTQISKHSFFAPLSADAEMNLRARISEDKAMPGRQSESTKHLTEQLRRSEIKAILCKELLKEIETAPKHLIKSISSTY